MENINFAMKEYIRDQKWEEVTVNRVYHSFLKGEFHKCISCLPFAAKNKELIDNPDFENESQNCKRAMLLSYRMPLLLKIPNSTVWHKVVSLRESHIDELIVIGRCGWDDDNDQNELVNVSKRKPIAMDSHPSNWDTPILWGHTKYGPFTIIEGNHRFVSIASLGNEIKFNIQCYIGLSTDYCCWHLPDS